MPTNALFIVGNSRSGTTMLGRILGTHQEVHTFHELHYFDSVAPAAKYDSQAVLSKVDCLKAINTLFVRERNGLYAVDNGDEFAQEANTVLEGLESYTFAELYSAFIKFETCVNGKSIPCKQSPYYLSYVEEIDRNITNAKYIYLGRDPRAVALSQKNRWRRNSLSGAKHPLVKEVLRSWANYHPYITSKIWVGCELKAEQFSGKKNFKVVRYEDLVSEPERTLKDLCSWLGIEYESNMIAIPFVGSSTRSDQSKTLGVDKSRKDAWRNGGLSNTELYVIQKVAGAEMSNAGYEPIAIKRNYLLLGLSFLSGIGKAVLSVVLNIHRSKNIITLLKRRLNR